MKNFRSPKTQKEYDQYKLNNPGGYGCFICEKLAIHTFSKWKIVENSFPYDGIASVHHMLLPLRHVDEKDLNTDELKELAEIKDSVCDKNYELMVLPTRNHRSVPEHFHLHLLVCKDKRI